MLESIGVDGAFLLGALLALGIYGVHWLVNRPGRNKGGKK